MFLALLAVPEASCREQASERVLDGFEGEDPIAIEIPGHSVALAPVVPLETTVEITMNHVHAAVCLMLVFMPESATCANEPVEVDSYGGIVTIRGESTGRFHLEQLSGRDCLVTPEGHGFWSLGVVHTAAVSRPGEGEADLFTTLFDRDWRRYSDATAANLREWGYNSVGYDSPAPLRRLMPYVADSYPAQTSAWRPDDGFQFPDVFDPEWQQGARDKIRSMVEPERGNPNLIGYYWTDTPQWELQRATRTRGTNWVTAIRNLPEDTPGRMRYQRFLVENDGRADDAAFLRLIARKYYAVIGEETRRLDPDGIVFGERYLFLDVPDFVVEEALPWIDAIALQPGGAICDGAQLDHLHELSGKPILLCDHQASFPTPAFPKTMWQQLASEEEVGTDHARYLADAFAKPYILGYHRCQYIDRFKPAQGVLKQGLLRHDGTPYESLVRSVTENNRAALQSFTNSTR